MLIDKIQWDSDFFNLSVGKIFTNENIQNLKFENFDLVYIFSDCPDLHYTLVDRKITYQIDDLEELLEHQKNEDFKVTFYDGDKDSYSDILSLTLQSGIYSRFYTDTNFSRSSYEDLYKEWIDKSIAKSLAEDIIIKKIDGKIVGFATLCRKTDLLADIGLVAVDSNYRGKGIGKEIIDATIKEAFKRGFKSIQVVTQLDNFGANSLYLSKKFKKKSITYIYHLWKM